MANLYFASEVKKLFNDKINALILSAADEEVAEKMVEQIRKTKVFREFADMIVADMEAADAEEEAKKKRDQEELDESCKAAGEAFDNLFNKKTWLKKEEADRDGRDDA